MPCRIDLWRQVLKRVRPSLLAIAQDSPVPKSLLTKWVQKKIMNL